MPNKKRPILYTFRRCPYAMRARMAIQYSGIEVELREILLKDKPEAMLQVSPKGTVPVLVSANEIIDESQDVLLWALNQNDPGNWFEGLTSEQQGEIKFLINRNDMDFKPWLDKYKYSVGYPEHSQDYYRKNAEVYLADLDARLAASKYLMGDKLTAADIAIFPFVRQFAFVDKAWFDQSAYANVRLWLETLLASDLFSAVMHKYQPWREGDTEIIFPITDKG